MADTVTNATDTIVDAVGVDETLKRWQQGIADNDMDLIGSAFAETALFQGLRPEPTFGREGVKEYYRSQPDPLTVDYEIVQLRPLGVQAVVAYLRPVFHPRGRDPLRTHLTLVLGYSRDGWLIEHYHVSLMV